MSRAKRAKKSIIPKILCILLLIAGIVYGLMNYGSEIKTKIASVTNSIGKADVKTYKANDYVNDYVKAVFTDVDGTRYIPIVYEKYDKQITASDIKAKFAEYGINITDIPSNVVNGSTVKTEKATYKVLIYGDVNSDGKINVLDAQKIVLHVINDGKGSNALTGIKALAANVEDVKENSINVRDAKRIVDFVLSHNTIIGSLPASDISKDTKAPVITIRGDEKVTIVKGRPYNDLGADVADDTDPNVKVVTTYPVPIDTNVIGEYKVVYTAKDISGKTSEAVRTVFVEEENTPDIIFDDEDLGEYIAINIADNVNDPNDEAVKYFESLKPRLGATAVDDKGNKLNVSITGVTDVDLSKPGKYKITYTSEENAQGNIGRRTRIIEVIDRVEGIVLKDNSNGQPYIYNEGDTISLDKLTANIYKVSRNHELNVPVTSFGKGEYKDFSLEITEDASEGKPITTAAYIGLTDPTFPLDDESTANRILTAKAIWTNPAPTSIESYKQVIGIKDNAGIMTVIGNIREIVKDPNFDTPDLFGEKYALLEVARLTTKKYQQNLTANSLKLDKVTITDENGFKINADSNTVNVEVDIDSNTGIASVKFWATEVGTYNIAFKLDSVIDGVSTTLTQEITDIQVSQSTKVDIIRPIYVDNKGTQLYEGILKVNGEAKQFDLKFEHNYGSSETAIVTEPVNVEASKVTVEFKNANGSIDNNIKYERITDNNGYLTGIKIIPPKTETVPENSYIEKEMIIYVDKSVGTNNSQISKKENIKIYPESKYTVTFDTEDITLYLKDTGLDNIYMDGNIVYTLIPATLKDQYSDINSTVYPYDPSTKKITAETLSANDGNLDIAGSVVIRDGATIADSTHTFIYVAGFNENGTKVSSGDIAYIGIALKDNGLGNEDKMLQANPYIEAYYVSNNSSGTEVITTERLNVKNIVKKNISTFTITTTKTKDYCYENSVVANVSTGPWEEDLLDLNSVTLEVSGTGSEATSSKELKVINNNPDGTINIKLNAKYAGEYRVKATLNEKRGSTWSPTNKTATTEAITVTDNPIITSVAFTYTENYMTSSGTIAQKTPKITERCSSGGKTEFGGVASSDGVNKNGAVRLGKTEMHKIVYYHDYYRGNTLVERRVIEDKDIMPSNQAVTITSANSLVISKATNGVSIPDSDTTSYVDGIAIRYSDTTLSDKHLTFDVTIDQSKYNAEDFTFTVGVNTIRQAMIKDVRLESLNNKGTYNLYVDTTKATQNGDTIYTSGGNNYTVFKIYYLDEDYDEVPIPASSISNTNTNTGPREVWILDDLATRGQALVKVVTLSRNSDEDRYYLDTGNNVMYVGIAPQKHMAFQKYSSKLYLHLGGSREHTFDLNIITDESSIKNINDNKVTSNQTDNKVNTTDLDNKVDTSVNTENDNKVDTSNNITDNKTGSDVQNENNVIKDNVTEVPKVDEDLDNDNIKVEDEKVPDITKNDKDISKEENVKPEF